MNPIGVNYEFGRGQITLFYTNLSISCIYSREYVEMEDLILWPVPLVSVFSKCFVPEICFCITGRQPMPDCCRPNSDVHTYF